MADKDCLREIGNELHRRLINGEGRRVTAEIAEVFLPLLVDALRKRFPGIADPHRIEIGAIDSLVSYFLNPGRYDPDRSPLFNYLYMDAAGDILNYLGRQKKSVELCRFAPEHEMAEVVGGDDPESRLIEKDSPLVERVAALISDPVDREVLQLMIDGERRTEAYVAALKIENLSPEEQARVVKRHKDRLKAVLRRGIRRKADRR